jgi:hypothetical protein
MIGGQMPRKARDERTGAESATAPPALDDGVYDIFVVNAETQPDGRTFLELTIVAGEHKGEVIEITATGLDRDELDLLGMPGSLTVADGAPHVQID